ncbi:MAG: pyridoxine 5'-phosphate synthase [Chitinophagales bacterium]|nr:pyridoxine 5'-phosphate synthase [Chitinophagales bacterium]
MTRLSVNINKIATLRNARGGNLPDVIKTAIDCERFGAQGITVHPRPDQRHIRYSDVLQLKEVVKTEFNIEGNPVAEWMEIVKQVKPAQATLVPDATDVITSNNGWDTIRHKSYLSEIISELKSLGIRVSVFVDPVPQMVEGAKAAGADRIELYTGPFAEQFSQDRETAIRDYVIAAKKAHEIELGINAGHDLNLHNLKFFKEHIPHLDEVSIGHAIICDAIYLGLENTIQMYRRQLVSD